MDIEKRVAIIEKVVDALVKSKNNEKFYSDAETNGIKARTEEVNTDLSALDDDIADSLLALAESISDMSMLIEEVNTNESDV